MLGSDTYGNVTLTIGLSSSNLPNGGSKFNLYGNSASFSRKAAPDIVVSVTNSEYPIRHMLHWDFNNISDLVGAFYNGGYKSGKAGSGWRDWYNGTNHRRQFKVFSGAAENGSPTFVESLWVDLTSGSHSYKQSATFEKSFEIGTASSGVDQLIGFWDPTGNTQNRLTFGIASDGGTILSNTNLADMLFYNNQGKYIFSGHNGSTGTIPLKLESKTPSVICATPLTPVATAEMTTVSTTGLEAGSASMYLDETNNKLMFKVLYSDGTTVKTGEISLT